MSSNSQETEHPCGGLLSNQTGHLPLETLGSQSILLMKLKIRGMTDDYPGHPGKEDKNGMYEGMEKTTQKKQ